MKSTKFIPLILLSAFIILSCNSTVYKNDSSSNRKRSESIGDSYVATDSLFAIGYNFYKNNEFKKADSVFKILVSEKDTSRVFIFWGLFHSLTEAKLGKVDSGKMILKSYADKLSKDTSNTLLRIYYLDRLLYINKWLQTFPKEPTELLLENGFTVKSKYIEPIGGINNISQTVEYPEYAKKAGIQGVVILGVCVNKFGKIVSINVRHSPDKILSDASIKAVMKSSFSPTVMNGINLSEYISIPILFRLK